VQEALNFGKHLCICLMVVLEKFANRNDKNFKNKNENLKVWLNFVF